MALWATRAHFFVFITDCCGRYYDERCPDGGITVPAPAFPDETERIAALAEASG